MAPGPQPPPGTLTSFTSSPSLSPYFTTTISQLQVLPPTPTSTPTLTASPPPPHPLFVASSLIFTPSLPHKLLIVQRSAHDYGGNLWEIPGGSCESNESILSGCVRELWEESGLVARRVVRQVGEKDVWGDNGRTWMKFSFEVVAVAGGDEGKDGEGMKVRLDEEEHQDFLWVTEEECREGVAIREGKKVEIKWTWGTQFEIIMEGFRLKREDKEVKEKKVEV